MRTTVAVYFFGGPLHGQHQGILAVDPAHALGAPLRIEAALPPKPERYINNPSPQTEALEVGVYHRTPDLEEGSVVYRWDGPEGLERLG